MRKLQIILMLVCLAVFVLTMGCESSTDDLLEEYQAYVASSQGLVSDYKDGTGLAEQEFVSQMRENMEGMEDVRWQMGTQCSQLDNCPTGGGATGEISGNHMNGGYILQARDMKEMQERETYLWNEMMEFERNGFGTDAGMYTDAGRGGRDDNQQDCLYNMENTLEYQYQSCNRMMMSGWNDNDMMDGWNDHDTMGGCQGNDRMGDNHGSMMGR